MATFVRGVPEFEAATARLLAAADVATRVAIEEAAHLVEAPGHGAGGADRDE